MPPKKSLQPIADIHIKRIIKLTPPHALLAALPAGNKIAAAVTRAREENAAIIEGRDPRLLVIVGPCSIHDTASAWDYAQKLAEMRKRYAQELSIVMRVYFEKPRTGTGWKGLINDPDLNETFDINKGLNLARRLLLRINGLGLPAATEFLDMITPQYYADLISWGAIGARTTESQVHRQLASGLSCPVGFKNGTDGNLKIAIDAVNVARHAHYFLSVTESGEAAIVETLGNPHGHIILRGGNKEPNYTHPYVRNAVSALKAAGCPPQVMIDCSHANSHKDYQREPLVAADVARQISEGENAIMGVMLESYLEEGKQDLIPGKPLTYGQSITDGCLGWRDTEKVLEELARAAADKIQRLR